MRTGLGTQTAFDFLSAKDLWRINALPQQASLSQNAQWRLQKPFKPFVKFCNLFVGYHTISYLKNESRL
jgi:hypothetical protein